MKNLMIVESPVKISTINKYLKNIVQKVPQFQNQSFNVIATVGHFNKLADIGVYRCGYDTSTGTIRYEPEKHNVKKELSNLKPYDNIYIATDLDNEGEGIAWQVRQTLPKTSYKNLYRIGFDEITESAISKALSTPIGFNENNYNAYQYRAIIDKLIGFYGSARLRSEVGQDYSTGRIQADVVLLSGDWQKEIENYKPDLRNRIKVTAFGSDGYLHSPDGKIVETTQKYQGKLKVVKVNVSSNQFSSKEEVRPFVLTDIINKFVGKYSPDTIASHLQTIKDKGYITYHRTDNPKMDDEFYNLNKNLATQFLAKHNLKAAQSKYLTGSDDPTWVAEMEKKGKDLHLVHSGIRTTNLLASTATLDLTEQQKEIYDYIAKQTISFFSAPNVYQTIEVTFEDENKYYTTLKYKNFLEINVYKDLHLRDDKKVVGMYNALKNLPPQIELEFVDEHSKVENVQVDVGKKPPLMNDANMIKKLEALGVGTPATIHSFIPISRKKQVIEQKGVKLTPKGWKLYEIFKAKQQEYFFANIHFSRDAFEKVIHKLEKGEGNLDGEIRKMLDKVDRKFDFNNAPTIIKLPYVNKKCSNCGNFRMIRETATKNGYSLRCQKSKVDAKPGQCDFEFISTDAWNLKPLEIWQELPEQYKQKELKNDNRTITK